MESLPELLSDLADFRITHIRNTEGRWTALRRLVDLKHRARALLAALGQGECVCGRDRRLL